MPHAGIATYCSRNIVQNSTVTALGCVSCFGSCESCPIDLPVGRLHAGIVHLQLQYYCSSDEEREGRHFFTYDRYCTMCVNGLLPSENKIYNCCQIERVVISSMEWKREPVGLVLNVATMRRCDERSGHMKRTIRCPIIEYSTVPVKQFCSHPSFRAQAIQFQNRHSTVLYSN